jgi:hypothetical protein
VRAAVLLVVLLAAGCLRPEAADETRYSFGGRFEAGTTDAQRAAVYAAIRDAGGVVETTADLPTSHFGGGNLRKADCERLSAWADGLDHVMVHVPCRVDPNDYGELAKA